MFLRSADYSSLTTRVAAWALVSASAGLSAPVALSSPTSDGLEQLMSGQRFERRVSLSTLGLRGPSVNIPAGSVQEFYFPSESADAARSLLVNAPANQPAPAFAVNGTAVAGQAVARGASGQTINTRLPLNTTQGNTRLAMQAGPAPADACTAAKATQGAVALTPDSHLSYYAASGAPAPTLAWRGAVASMPDRPFMLVAAPPITPEVFDTAWRVGVSMARLGRTVAVHTLPKVGDFVDTRRLSIPAQLASIPAFSVLRDATAHHYIGHPAEVGALLLLDAPDVLADILIVDPQLQRQINSALDALLAQITDDAARDILLRWREQKMPIARATDAVPPLTPMAFGARPAWMVAAAGAASVTALDTGTRWVPLSGVADGAARTPSSMADHPLVHAHAAEDAGRFTVRAPQNWSATFALNAPLTGNHTPSRVEIDFELPKDFAQQKPVGVLHWNGILLAATQLTASTGHETLSARIPVYALSATNLLQVSVKQNTPMGDCAQAVTIPSTALRLKVEFDAAPAFEPSRHSTFADLIPQLGQSEKNATELAVPRGYLTQAESGIAAAINLAAATNMSPDAAKLVLVDAQTPYKPARPFVALDIPMEGAKRALSMQDNQIQFRGTAMKDLNWPQTQGVTAMQVVQSGNQAGLLWYPLDGKAAPEPTGLLVNRGQYALLGTDSQVAWIDQSGSVVLAADASTTGPLYEWRSLFSWGVPVTLVLLGMLIFLLISAAIATRRAKHKTQHQEGSA